jgi:hypothetical protein
MKVLKAAGALAMLALLFPGAASAHTGSATVSCTSVDFHYTKFVAGSNTVHYKVTVDNAVVAAGDFVLNEAGGQSGTLHVPLSVTGAHDVAAYTWWGPGGIADQNVGGNKYVPAASGHVDCAAPSPPPTIPPPPATPAPPAPTPAPAPPAAAPAPAQGVQGVKVVSPARTAVLGAQTSCASRVVRVTVRGRSMRRISFSVNGRHVRTVTVRSGQRSVIASLPMTNRRASQVVTARVTFGNGARARTLSARASRCAQVAVQPQFTG